MPRIQRLTAAFLTVLALTSGPSAGTSAQAQAAVREIVIAVDGGYEPNRIEVQEGEPVRLKLVRKEYNGCTREVVFPKLNIRRELPPDETVVIDLSALPAGEYEFRCGMGMIRGTLVVIAQRH